MRNTIGVVLGLILGTFAFISADGSAATPIPAAARKAVNREAPTKIVALPQSVIRIDGDSTVRKYSSTASSAKFNVKAQGSGPLEVRIRELEIIIPVKALKSGDGKLDDHLEEAMEAGKFPHIRVLLSTFKLDKKGADGTRAATASGDITIHGVTRPIQVTGSLSADGNTLRIKGEKPLLMSDYGIKPPTMMLGTLKTRNEINVVYELVLSQQS